MAIRMRHKIGVGSYGTGATSIYSENGEYETVFHNHKIVMIRVGMEIFVSEHANNKSYPKKSKDKLNASSKKILEDVLEYYSILPAYELGLKTKVFDKFTTEDDYIVDPKDTPIKFGSSIYDVQRIYGWAVGETMEKLIEEIKDKFIISYDKTEKELEQMFGSVLLEQTRG